MSASNLRSNHTKQSLSFPELHVLCASSIQTYLCRLWHSIFQSTSSFPDSELYKPIFEAVLSPEWQYFFLYISLLFLCNTLASDLCFPPRQSCPMVLGCSVQLSPGVFTSVLGRGLDRNGYEFGNKEVTSETEICNYNIFEDMLCKMYFLGYFQVRKLLTTYSPVILTSLHQSWNSSFILLPLNSGTDGLPALIQLGWLFCDINTSAIHYPFQVSLTVPLQKENIAISV